MTPQAQEKNQRLWWYLMCAGIVLLGVETVLSNRMAKPDGVAAVRAYLRKTPDPSIGIRERV